MAEVAGCGGKVAGRLFLAGIRPGLLLGVSCALTPVIHFRKEFAAPSAIYRQDGATSAILARDDFTMRSASTCLPAVLLRAVAGRVMIALYGGYATPSETAGLGAAARTGA